MHVMTNLDTGREIQLFAEQAAEYFSGHSEKCTFTKGRVEPGELFAMRWGLDEKSLLVFRIDPEQPVVNYQHAIRGKA